MSSSIETDEILPPGGQVLRFAAAHRPAVLLLENVPHLVTIDDGAALLRIIAEISSLGYKTHHSVLSSRNIVSLSLSLTVCVTPQPHLLHELR